MMQSTSTGQRHSNKNSPRGRRSDYNCTDASVNSNVPKSAFKAISKENTTPRRNFVKGVISVNSDLIDENAPATQVKGTQHKKISKASDNMIADNSSKKKASTTPKASSPLKDECLKLLRAKQFRSCEIMTMYYLSSVSSTADCIDIYAHKATAYEILGDCALNQDQLNRAVSFYKKALSNLKCLREPMSSSSLHKIL